MYEINFQQQLLERVYSTTVTGKTWSENMDRKTMISFNF